MPLPIRDEHKRGMYISDVYRKYKLGKITADQMLERQRLVMPTCEYCHSEPSIARTADGFICSACYLRHFKDTTHG